MKETLIKSPLNYTGGKYKLLPQILPLFPKDINTFIDVFSGGLNVACNVHANKIICNDINSDLISLYTCWKNEEIEKILRHIDNKIEEFNLSKTNEKGYYSLREDFNKNKNILDLYVLICYSFNNQIRFNKKGEFNLPFGKNRSEFNTSLKAKLPIFLDKIKSFKFTCLDFKNINLYEFNENDFFYLDPPYLISTASYNENNLWNHNKEIELLQFLDDLNSLNIKFALSNVIEHKGRQNQLLKDFSKKYNVHEINSNYSNCSYQLKNKSATKEILLTNY